MSSKNPKKTPQKGQEADNPSSVDSSTVTGKKTKPAAAKKSTRDSIFEKTRESSATTSATKASTSKAAKGSTGSKGAEPSRSSTLVARGSTPGLSATKIPASKDLSGSVDSERPGSSHSASSLKSAGSSTVAKTSKGKGKEPEPDRKHSRSQSPAYRCPFARCQSEHPYLELDSASSSKTSSKSNTSSTKRTKTAEDPKLSDFISIDYGRDQLVGKLRSKGAIEYGTENYPLVWAELKKMNLADRNKNIIKRVNFFCQVNSFTANWKFYDALEVAKENAKNDPGSYIKPTKPLPMPVKKIKEWLPYHHSTGIFEDRFKSDRERMWPDKKLVTDVFDETMTKFKASKSCKRVKEMARRTFQQVAVKRIVAFGGHSIYTVYPPRSASTLRVHTQHILLLVLREVWKEKNPGGKLPIFLQDPLYPHLDVEIAKKYEMEIVCCDYGHQMGYTEIDEDTLVVDLTTCFPLWEVIAEISRPAALFTPFILQEDDFSNEPYSIVIKNPKPGHEGESIQIPDSGMKKATSVQFLNLYTGETITKDEQKAFDITPLDNRDDNITAVDGSNGHTHFGTQPTMYTRKRKP